MSAAVLVSHGLVVVVMTLTEKEEKEGGEDKQEMTQKKGNGEETLQESTNTALLYSPSTVMKKKKDEIKKQTNSPSSLTSVSIPHRPSERSNDDVSTKKDLPLTSRKTTRLKVQKAAQGTSSVPSLLKSVSQGHDERNIFGSAMVTTSAGFEEMTYKRVWTRVNHIQKPVYLPCDINILHPSTTTTRAGTNDAEVVTSNNDKDYLKGA